MPNEADEANREVLQEIRYLESEVAECDAAHEKARDKAKVAKTKLKTAMEKLRRKIRGEEEPDLFDKKNKESDD